MPTREFLIAEENEERLTVIRNNFMLRYCRATTSLLIINDLSEHLTSPSKPPFVTSQSTRRLFSVKTAKIVDTHTRAHYRHYETHKIAVIAPAPPSIEPSFVQNRSWGIILDTRGNLLLSRKDTSKRSLFLSLFLTLHRSARLSSHNSIRIFFQFESVSLILIILYYRGKWTRNRLLR